MKRTQGRFYYILTFFQRKRSRSFSQNPPTYRKLQNNVFRSNINMNATSKQKKDRQNKNKTEQKETNFKK